MMILNHYYIDIDMEYLVLLIPPAIYLIYHTYKLINKIRNKEPIDEEQVRQLVAIIHQIIEILIKKK